MFENKQFSAIIHFPVQSRDWVQPKAQEEYTQLLCVCQPWSRMECGRGTSTDVYRVPAVYQTSFRCVAYIILLSAHQKISKKKIRMEEGIIQLLENLN